MPSGTSIKDVIVVPRNGYANRLQAWASASILAAQFDVPVKVLWESEQIASTHAERMFQAHGVGSTFISADDLTRTLQIPHQELPRYLTIDSTRGFIGIAGHDLGEQVFVDRLPEILITLTDPMTLVIIAGGQFHLPATHDFATQRHIFYRHLAWSDELDIAYAHQLEGRGEFVALHVRETDRSLDAPTSRQVQAALTELRRTAATNAILICADTSEARDHWSMQARSLGFDPWSVGGVEFDRESSANGVSALLDWRLLAHAKAVIYPGASTFSSEAVVAGASRTNSQALYATTATRVRRKVGASVQSMAMYPSRRIATRRG